MKRAEIERKFDEIVSFAELEKFLDTPVKHYSSGMYVRLAFAVAAHLDPEILLVDEVLAVGDAAFQKKCLGKMGEVAQEGRTVLFVSHNMAAVENLCSRGIVLHDGKLNFSGSQTQAISEYLRRMEPASCSLRERKDRLGSGQLRVLDIELKDRNGHRVSSVCSGQSVDIQLPFEMVRNPSPSHVIASIQCRTMQGAPVFLHHNRLTGQRLGPVSGNGTFVLHLRRLPLPPSTYRLSYSVIAGGDYLDGIKDALELNVTDGDYYGSGEVPPASHGVCLVDGDWEMRLAGSSE
jgi:lipopolysaccharide transport system ATP-binding protein